MTLNLAAIFGDESTETLIVTATTGSSAAPVTDWETTVSILPTPIIDSPAPIIEGTEHFSLWVDDTLGPWPEFIPGHHYDLRQPSRLRGMLAPPDKGNDQ